MYFHRRKIIFILILSLMFTMIVSCSSYTKKETTIAPAKSLDDQDWQQSSSGTLSLSNDKTLFELDSGTGHFTITNKIDGKKYLSVPNDVTASSEDTQNRLASELSIRYYDDYSKSYDMYSSKDSVDNGGVEVKYIDNKIRVYYSFGALSSNYFNPKVLTEDAYENKVLPNLTGVNARHIGLYYTLYSRNDKSENYQIMLQQYPSLEKENLYIINQNISTTGKIEIEEIMSKAKYTKEMYELALKNMGITESIGTEPGFIVPVEYELKDDGFTATVLTDKIKEKLDSFMLQQIDLLEYFACTGEEISGQYFVPDGSGALIEMNSKVEGNYSQSFYGNDYSILVKKASQLTQTATLPIFGNIQKDNGIFAIVEGAAAVSTLTVRTRGFVYPQNTAFISYAYRTKDIIINSQLSGGDTTKGEFNVYCTSELAELPSVRFILMSGENANYSGMATYYRDYLLKEGILAKSNVNNDVIYLDFNCLITSKKSILGFSYDQKINLSTLKDIILFVQSLYDNGVKHIVIRINGYDVNGLSHGANDSFQLDKSAGTMEEMIALAELVTKNGGALYLNADFQFIYKSSLFDGFSERRDCAYYLDRSLVNRGDYDIVTREYSNTIKTAYLLTPVKYYDYATSFLKSLNSKYSGKTPIGISYNTAGQTLGGDYNRKKDINRTLSQKYVEKALEAVAENAHTLMTDGGNEYVLPYTAHILNLPLASSEFDAETRSIPFYQMVMHGSISYTGMAYNKLVDTKDYLLQIVENGANPYFSLINNDNNLIVGTEYNSKLYSLNAKEWQLTIQNICNKLDAYYSLIENAYIVNHEELSPDVFCTTYDNGVLAFVNYSSQPYTVDGVSINAGNFYIKEPINN